MKTKGGYRGLLFIFLLVWVSSVGCLRLTPEPVPEPEGELISLGKPAIADPGNWSAGQANDGDPSTRWATGSDQYPAWWQVDLGGQYQLTWIEILWYQQESRAYQYKVEISANGTDFDVVIDKLNNNASGPTRQALDHRGRFVRITLEGAFPEGWPSINEVSIYGLPLDEEEEPTDLESLWLAQGNQELAQGQAAQANQAGFPAANALDGNLETRWGTIDGSVPAWWQVDLGDIYELAGIGINWYNEAIRAHQYRVEISEDGEEFTTVVDKTDNITFGPTADGIGRSARYVRITITGVHPQGWPSICEVRVYGK